MLLNMKLEGSVLRGPSTSIQTRITAPVEVFMETKLCPRV